MAKLSFLIIFVLLFINVSAVVGDEEKTGKV
jgi:hypothetical protein